MGPAGLQANGHCPRSFHATGRKIKITIANQPEMIRLFVTDDRKAIMTGP